MFIFKPHQGKSFNRDLEKVEHLPTCLAKLTGQTINNVYLHS